MVDSLKERIEAIKVHSASGETVLFTPDVIDICFEAQDNPYDVIMELYSRAVPDWNDPDAIAFRKKPEINQVTSHYIHKRFTEFDRLYHKCRKPGTLWLEYCFAINNNIGDFKVFRPYELLEYRE